jgi:hypothetical protein
MQEYDLVNLLYVILVWIGFSTQEPHTDLNLHLG